MGDQKCINFGLQTRASRMEQKRGGEEEDEEEEEEGKANPRYGN